MMPIKTIMDVIQSGIFEGCKFLSNIGLSIFVMFIAIEFIKAAIDATSGRGFHLDKILYLYLFMAVFYATFPTLQAVLKNYAYEGCKQIYDQFGVLNLAVKPSFSKFGMAVVKGMMTNPLMFVGQIIMLPFNIIVYANMVVYSLIIGVITLMVIDVIVVSVFLTFEIVIAAAPFFIPFFMSKEVNHIGKQWLNNILMHCMQLPLLAVILKLGSDINSQVTEKFLYENVITKLQFWKIVNIMFVPLLVLGMIWQALNLTKMLFPPSGGFIGTAIGAPIAGAVGYTVHSVQSIATRG